MLFGTDSIVVLYLTYLFLINGHSLFKVHITTVRILFWFRRFEYTPEILERFKKEMDDGEQTIKIENPNSFGGGFGGFGTGEVTTTIFRLYVCFFISVKVDLLVTLLSATLDCH